MSTVAVNTTNVRTDKVSVLYGTVASTGYSVGDTLSFNKAQIKDLISAKFVTVEASPKTLELFNNVDISSAVRFPINSASAKAITYRIEYVRGTGKTTGATASQIGKTLSIAVVNASS